MIEAGNRQYEDCEEQGRSGRLFPGVRVSRVFPRGGRYHAKGEVRHERTYLFTGSAERERWLAGVLADHKAVEERKAKTKAQRAAPHPLKVGDVLRNSWGYDQTNIDYFEVVRTTKHMVWLKALAQETRETGFLSGKCKPRPGVYLDKPVTKHRVGADGAVKIHSWGSYARKVDPETESYWSSYA